MEARITSRETKSPTLSKVQGWGGGQELKASPAVAYGQVRSRGETWQETEAGALLSEDRGAEETHLESVQGVLTWPPLPPPGHTAYSRKQGEGP